MLAGKRCAQRILADSRIDAVDLVGDHGTAISYSVNEDPSVTLTLRHGQGSRVNIIREVSCILVVGPEVHDFVSHGLQLLFDFIFHVRSRVVVRHCDLHKNLLIKL